MTKKERDFILKTAGLPFSAAQLDEIQQESYSSAQTIEFLSKLNPEGEISK